MASRKTKTAGAIKAGNGKYQFRMAKVKKVDAGTGYSTSHGGVIEGARMLGQLDRIGSLKPGKQADLVLIRADDLNMQPVNDAVNSVVMQTSLANIDSVMVAGRWKKRHGKLTGIELEPKLVALHASGQKIAQALAG